MTIQTEVLDLEQQISQHQQELQKAQQGLRDLKELVKLGTLTLDTPLDDFVFAWHEGNRAYWHDFYTALEQICIEDTPIMIEHSGTEAQLASTRWGGPNTYRSAMYLNKHIGILKSTLEYDLKKGQIIFPVKIYLVHNSDRFLRGMSDQIQVDTSIPVSAGSFKNYGRYINYHHVEGDLSSIPSDHSMEIKFGSKEEYLRRRATQLQESQESPEYYSSLFEKPKLLGPYNPETKQLTFSQ